MHHLFACMPPNMHYNKDINLKYFGDLSNVKITHQQLHTLDFLTDALVEG